MRLAHPFRLDIASGPPGRRLNLPPFLRVLPPNSGIKAANCDTMAPNSADSKHIKDQWLKGKTQETGANVAKG